MEQIGEIANVYRDFLMDANDEDEKAVSAIAFLFPNVDMDEIRNELFNLRQFSLRYILFRRVEDQSIADLIFQEVQSRAFQDKRKWDIENRNKSILIMKEYIDHTNDARFNSEEEKLEAIGLLFSKRLLGEPVDPIIQLGKRTSMRNLAFINSTLDFAMENGMSFVSYFF